MALGGSRSRLLRLWLTESLLLAVSAGIVGLFVASWMLYLVVAFQPPTLIGQAEAPTLPLNIGPDLRVFVFTLGLSALTAVIVGLISGFQGSNPGVIRAMKGGRTTDRRFAPGFNVRSTVIALQMALSMILLVPCGLMVRSWLNASAVAPGFSTENVLLLPISTDQAGVRVRKPDGFEQQLIERVAILPGVEAATVMDPVPLWFGGSFAHFSIESGQASRASERIGFTLVGPMYFETLRVPLLRGRSFTASDNASASLVAIVNETMARRFWPDGNALGQHIRNRDHAIEIVGIARDAKYQSLAESARPWLYRPLAQTPTDNPTLSLAVRTTGDPMPLRSAIEREVKALVPTWPAFQFRTLDEGLRLQQLLPRLGATLLGVLGGFGLILAAVGVYGVMTYVVRQRANEIGIRLALGSPTFNLMALVMKQSLGGLPGRRRHRHWRGAHFDPPALEPALRRERCRSFDLCSGAAFAPRGRVAGLLHPRPACHQDECPGSSSSGLGHFPNASRGLGCNPRAVWRAPTRPALRTALTETGSPAADRCRHDRCG